MEFTSMEENMYKLKEKYDELIKINEQNNHNYNKSLEENKSLSRKYHKYKSKYLKVQNELSNLKQPPQQATKQNRLSVPPPANNWQRWAASPAKP